jgi:Flp pilus assembly pilin Flp
MTENTASAEHGAPMRRAALLHRLRDDHGAATAEYVIATMAAVGFAGLLVVILTSDEIRTVLTDMVNSALTYAS